MCCLLSDVCRMVLDNRFSLCVEVVCSVSGIVCCLLLVVGRRVFVA